MIGCNKDCLNCQMLVCKHDIEDRHIYLDEFSRKKEQEHHRKYYEAHKAEIDAKNSLYTESRRASVRRYYQKHKEELKQKQRQRYAEKREERLQKAKEYYQAHKDEISKKRKEQRKAKAV